MVNQEGIEPRAHGLKAHCRPSQTLRSWYKSGSGDRIRTYYFPTSKAGGRTDQLPRNVTEGMDPEPEAQEQRLQQEQAEPMDTASSDSCES